MRSSWNINKNILDLLVYFCKICSSSSQWIHEVINGEQKSECQSRRVTASLHLRDAISPRSDGIHAKTFSYMTSFPWLSIATIHGQTFPATDHESGCFPDRCYFSIRSINKPAFCFSNFLFSTYQLYSICSFKVFGVHRNETGEITEAN